MGEPPQSWPTLLRFVVLSRAVLRVIALARIKAYDANNVTNIGTRVQKHKSN
jgi:hypothetical protein